ncbi:lipocalin family protein [Flavobacterium sp. NKUCC04_CG]|uniref:lipocalin family protein n=1 Tax=Flavobacterium sp. NKUCC04_CG TaxID=2842121 RepID=UPI001C5A92A0|nr:lipocalin family protein [Flavobacterium sp. NKUCC04_CG]MBW3519399.1 lipocalin family protein [Flavobacterium sp. NKUCC04_CG]
MRKLIVLSVMALFAVSCKPTMDSKSQVGIKGNWTLTNVKNIGGEFVKINSFNIADSKCFVGSQWNFVSNNNSGNLSLNAGGNCPEFSSNFKWTISPAGEFSFKFVDQGEKAKHVTTGYALRIANQSESSFQLVDKINVGGQSSDVIYQFQRN